MDLNSLMPTQASNVQKRQAAGLVNKWQKTGLLEGLNHDYEKSGMAVLLENQAKQLVSEANSTGTITTLATSSITSLAEPGDDATAFTLNSSDFNNQISFYYPNKARLLISSSVDFESGEDIFITSVWRQEIKI